MKRRSWIHAVPVLAALLLFGAWVGSGPLHEHPGDPSCAVCKQLQASPLDLGKPGATPEPLGSPERVLLALTPAPGERLVLVPPGRGPPLS